MKLGGLVRFGKDHGFWASGRSLLCGLGFGRRGRMRISNRYLENQRSGDYLKRKLKEHGVWSL